MHSATIFFALAVVASVAAVAPIGVVNDIWARPAYTSTYSVSDKLTGDQKSATEVRDGDVTKGSYSLVQPDGVLRTVNYIVTPHGGFQAQVINKGVAGHPAIVGIGKGVGIGGVGIGGLGGVGIGGLGGVGIGGLGGVGIGGIRAIAAPGLAVGGLGLGLGGARSVVGGLGLGSVAGLGLGWGAGLGGVGIIG